MGTLSATNKSDSLPENLLKLACKMIKWSLQLLLPKLKLKLKFSIKKADTYVVSTISILELMYCHFQRLPIRIEYTYAYSVAINLPIANSLPSAKISNGNIMLII